jgi:hypothetical protein
LNSYEFCDDKDDPDGRIQLNKWSVDVALAATLQFIQNKYALFDRSDVKVAFKPSKNVDIGRFSSDNCGDSGGTVSITTHYD